MADSEVDTTQQVADSEVDTTQQGTLQTAATKPKNPKRVAAGKGAAQKTKLAREAQKKALAEAQTIIANNQIKPDPPTAPEPPAAPELPAMTTTQWLSVISIILSFHWRGYTTNAKRSKAFLPSRRHRLFCHELPRHRPVEESE